MEASTAERTQQTDGNGRNVGRIEEILKRHPEAAAYAPGAIL